MRLLPVMLLTVPLLAACATDVHRRATPAELLDDVAQGEIRLLASLRPVLAAGKASELRAGTRCRVVGRIDEGVVYAPTEGLLQVRTEHAYEAYLVVREGRLTGVFLPVERLFLPVREPVPLNLETSS